MMRAMDSEGRWNDHESVFTLYARSWYYCYPFYSAVMPLRALTAFLRAIE
jgi:hypothetical protein